jgi:hypothetical protein
MAYCEYRRTNPVDLGVQSAVAVSDVLTTKQTQAICLVKVDKDPMYPICELPDMGTANCPIAQFDKGTITLEETNTQLTNIFDAKKSQKV